MPGEGPTNLDQAINQFWSFVDRFAEERHIGVGISVSQRAFYSADEDDVKRIINLFDGPYGRLKPFFNLALFRHVGHVFLEPLKVIEGPFRDPRRSSGFRDFPA